MLFLPTPENLWIYVAIIAGGMVVACLRIIGHAYYEAVRRHDLRVEVHRLRAEQQRRLDTLARIEAGANERPRRAKRRLPDNLLEPMVSADEIVEVGEVATPEQAAA